MFFGLHTRLVGLNALPTAVPVLQAEYTCITKARTALLHCFSAAAVGSKTTPIAIPSSAIDVLTFS
jgi:hypothetical protein